MIIKSERYKNGKLLVYTDQDIIGKTTKTVYYDYRPVIRFDPNIQSEQKKAAIDLYELGHCTRGVAAKISGLHRNTVYKILKTKKLLGLEAAIQSDNGPKAAWKYILEIRTEIKKIIRKYPEWSDEEVAEEGSKRLGMEITRSGVQRIRREKEKNKEAREKKEVPLKEIEKLARIVEEVEKKKYDERQLKLNFESDKEFEREVEEAKKEEETEGKTEREERLIERLKEGERNSFAGGLFYNLFIEEIGIEAGLGRILDINNSYSLVDVMLTIFHGLNIGVRSIEGHKLINRNELGVLIGDERSPEKETIRERIKKAAEGKPTEKLMSYFAERFLEEGIIEPGVFFIDGHFLPYYGLEKIAKGYHTVRRMAMNGNMLYAITDIEGMPLMYITENSDIDFRPMIKLAAERVIEIGIKRPILVFDKGGYGVNFFGELGMKADFITWGKYINKSKLEGGENKTGLIFGKRRFVISEKREEIKESRATAKKEGREEAAKVKVRVVILEEFKKDVDEWKQAGDKIAIITNNMEKEAYEIAYYMVSRWGASENYFKEMLGRYNFNYHPGYDIEELEKQPLIDNPEIEEIKNRIKELKKRLLKILKEKDELESKEKQGKRTDKRRSEKIDELEKEKEEIKKEIVEFEKKLKEIPDKISIFEVLGRKKMGKADLEKKRLYDLIQMLAYHGREFLIKIFRDCYNDMRDIKQVMDMILNWPGYVKLYGRTLIVLLDWIENRKHREAADKFCQIMNQRGLKLFGTMDIKLIFKVSCKV